jgi:phenol 2-monooxygenase
MIDDCVLLAGDACHTHSSGAAQGMNTGVHDAINLSWKLGGVLRGWYKPGLLHTYDSERRPVAESVIEQDEQYSKLISGDQDRKTSEGGDANQLLANLMRGSAQFVLGLGIGYDENMINLNPNAGCLQAGTRPDDALIYPPGRTVPVRFQQVTPNNGGFWAIIFTGNIAITRPRLQALRRHLDSHGNFGQSHLPPGVVQCLTVINGCKPQAEEALGMPTFGPFYYDQHAIVQEKFGFTESEGGIAVLRPDGYLGFATALTKGPEVDAYFRRFVVEPRQSTLIARL